MQSPEPMQSPDRNYVQAGDLVLMVGGDRKPAIVRIQPDLEYQTHHGVLQHSQIIGKGWGATVETHLGYAYMILPPSLDDLVRDIQRVTQIVYPKEIGHILMKMNIGPGTRLVEAGTGSGGLTLALARMVQPHGHVYTYEVRPEIQAVAQKNLARLGLEPYVTFKVRDIAEGLDETALDAAILDVREPWLYLEQVRRALRGGGFLVCLVPTVNQVGVLLRNLEMQAYGFVEVEELLVRPYKAVAARLRPYDRMVAHTAYMIFARALIPETQDRTPADQPDADLS